MKKGLAAAGLSAAVTLGACSGLEKTRYFSTRNDIQGGIGVAALTEARVLANPNAINDPKAVLGVLRVGQTATATCYFKSATLAVDLVGIAGSEQPGYVSVSSPGDSAATLNTVDTFNVPAAAFQVLPLCPGSSA